MNRTNKTATPMLLERPLLLLLAVFIGLAAAYSIINPIHEGTDELRHYRFVRYLVENKSLPVQGEEACRSQSHHPPLIYALGALATEWVDTGRGVCENPPENPFWGYRYWEVGTDNKNLYLHGPEERFPWHGEALAAHIVRFINVLLGAGTVLLTYLTARVIWPQREGMALGSAAILAFSPMFLYMSGTINNDVVAALSGAAVIYVCVRVLADLRGLDPWWGIILGCVYGLALMSKFNLAPVIFLMELVLLWVAWRRKQWREWLTANIILVLFAGVIAGWWFGRNYAIYGDPTGFQEVTELWGVRSPSESWRLVLQEVPQVWSSLWGRFGYGQIPLPQAIYTGLQYLTVTAMVGLVLAAATVPLPDQPLPFGHTFPKQAALILLALTVIGFMLVVATYMLVSPAGAMGRFFFPAMPAFTILLFYGLHSWLDVLWARQQPAAVRAREGMRLAVLVSFAMFGLALVALVGYLAPAYASPSRWQEGAAVPNPIAAEFDSLVKLHGYELSQTAVLPGETIKVTLYWEVLNQPPGEYWLFAHLVDEAGQMVAQRDTHPAAGKFPTTQWRPGDRFVDALELTIPETTYVGTAELKIGLYAPNSYRLAVHDGAGHSLGDALSLGKIRLAAAPGPFPNNVRIRFADTARLVGFSYNGREFKAGDTLEVTLYWEVIRPSIHELEAQVHLLAADERVMGEANAHLPQPPGHGRIVKTTHSFIIQENLPPDILPISVNLFDIFTKKRIDIVAEDGRYLDNEVQLARVRVIAPDSER